MYCCAEEELTDLEGEEEEGEGASHEMEGKSSSTSVVAAMFGAARGEARTKEVAVPEAGDPAAWGGGEW